MNTGVFVYLQVDLAADATPHDILDFQVNDMRSRRRNFTELAAENRVAAVPAQPTPDDAANRSVGAGCGFCNPGPGAGGTAGADAGTGALPGRS